MAAEDTPESIPELTADEIVEQAAVSAAQAWRRTIARVLCKCCGYEPPRDAAVPGQCPKCYSGCWERFIWRGKLRPPQAKRVRPPSRPNRAPAPRPTVTATP